jgi:hypothetical protein
MSDPRNEPNPQQRSANLSPLMKGLLVQRATGRRYNGCVFGCQDHELDDNGYCAHLVGFYDKGNTYEPRVVRKKDKRIVVSGAARQPMKKGFVLVRITTCARVYSPEPAKHLAVTRDDSERVQNDIMEQERKLLEAAERVRTPNLEGEWDDTGYELRPTTAAATT